MVARSLRGLAALVIVALVAGCSTSDAGGGIAETSSEHPAQTTAHFEGGLVSPRRAAPPLRLRDARGRVIDIRDLRGRPVLVTFVYATCPDVCPLIMQNLKRVREQSGELGQSMRVLAVSVDPERDTRPVVRRFLTSQGLGGFVSYLVGTRADLEPVWDDWQVARDVPKTDPELIEHSALIYGVTAGGKLATAYPVGFAPEAIVRDLALLARP